MTLTGIRQRPSVGGHDRGFGDGPENAAGALFWL
jgi:hypothetical protein